MLLIPVMASKPDGRVALLGSAELVMLPAGGDMTKELLLGHVLVSSRPSCHGESWASLLSSPPLRSRLFSKEGSTLEAQCWLLKFTLGDILALWVIARRVKNLSVQ